MRQVPYFRRRAVDVSRSGLKGPLHRFHLVGVDQAAGHRGQQRLPPESLTI
jgi:hypothetical protein